MRKPDESPTVQPVDDAREVDPKHPASLTVANEISMLKPLGEQNVLLTVLLGYRSLWYVQLLTAGIGTLAMMALVVVSAIVIGVEDRGAGLDVAINESTDIRTIAQISFDIFSPPVLAAAAASLEPRANVRPKLARAEARLATYKPRRDSRSSS